MKLAQRRIGIGRIVISSFLIGFAALAIWQALFHGAGDRKDLRYQGWKLGIYPMDLDQATSTMIGDVHPERLVVGKTKDQLIKKFGYATPIDQAPQYVKYCFFNSPYYGKQVFMLRHSNWMVLMKDGRAEQLLLVKGC